MSDRHTAPSTTRDRCTTAAGDGPARCARVTAAPAPSEAAAPLRRHGAAGRGVDARHVGVPGHRDHVLRRPVHGLPGLPLGVSPTGFQEASHHLNMYLGRRQHRRPHRQLADDGARRARGADERAAEDAGRLARRDDGPRHGLPRRQGRSSTRDKFDAPPRARPELRVGTASTRTAAEIFYSLYFCMTGLHALHMIIGLGHHDRHRDHGVARQFDASYYTPVEVVRPLLALRRHRLDFPLPAAVPDRRTLRQRAH